MEASTEPPNVEVLYRCQFCARESKLVGFANPGLLLFLVGIPLFAFTFCGLAYFLPGPFGLVQWLVMAVAGWIAAPLGALLIQRLIYQFTPIGQDDGERRG